MLGFEVAQSTVSKYMARPSKLPSQTWKTFLRNHAEAIAAIDMCVVPTLTFDLLFAFLVLGHGRRQLLWFEVTRHPTAEWLARQITEAFPWTSAPAYLVRDNDRAYGHVFTSRVRAMGIRDRPISPGSPWQNGCAERLIGTLRRECLDHSSARCTCGEFFPLMRRITIKLARTWHYRKMRPCIEQSNDLAPLSPFRSWLDCTTNTSGYDFRKGQVGSSVQQPKQKLTQECHLHSSDLLACYRCAQLTSVASVATGIVLSAVELLRSVSRCARSRLGRGCRLRSPAQAGVCASKASIFVMPF